MAEKKSDGMVTVCLSVTVTTAKGDIPPGEPVELPEEEATSLVARFGEQPQIKSTPKMVEQPPSVSGDRKMDGEKS